MLVMNHHVERDRESLRFCLESAAAYIGVLGPRSRYRQTAAGLAAQGYTPDSGHALAGAQSRRAVARRGNAEEVAVSILGEILALRRGFEGGFLSGSARSIHVPEGRRLLASS